jgi:sec-independent protein translocase protein TatC
MAIATKYDQRSEDMFADTRMSFGEHIEDLRAHLLRAIYGFVIALLLSFFVGKAVVGFIARPVEVALTEYWERYYKQRSDQVLRDLAEGDPQLQQYNRPQDVDLYLPREVLGGGPPNAGRAERPVFDVKHVFEEVLERADLGELLAKGNSPDDRWIKVKAKLANPLGFFAKSKSYEPLVGRRPTLATLRVEEAFMVYIKVSIVTGFVLASPWVFYQLWSFIAAGLYPNEKRYVNVFLPFSIGLFLAGVLMCEFLVIPKAIQALLWFNEWLGLQPELRLNDWLGFAILLPLVFGLSFQTPLVMLFVERIGLLTVDQMRHSRRIAWFVMAVFAAVVTPTDAFSMIFLWIPMSLLYELGILLCRLQPPRSALDDELPEAEENFEV